MVCLLKWQAINKNQGSSPLNRTYETIKNLARKAKYKFDVGNPQFLKYQMGNFTYGKPTVLRWGKESSLTIGSFCSIATGVVIVLDGIHTVDWVTTYPFTAILKEFGHLSRPAGTKGSVVIGNDVWIGMDALILSGVTVGDGAVIGAQCVITKDVEPYSIVAGNPANIIRKRFDEKTIDELLKIKWWNWPMSRIKENMPLMLSNNIQEFINKNKP